MTEQLTKPFAAYPHTKQVGPFIFLAGQGCRDPETNTYPATEIDEHGTVTSYDIKEQTRGVFANIKRALANKKCSLANLVDVTVFLVDMQDFEAMNQVWNETFAEIEPPTRTTVSVRKLPGHNMVEMKAIAYSDRN